MRQWWRRWRCKRRRSIVVFQFSIISPEEPSFPPPPPPPPPKSPSTYQQCTKLSRFVVKASHDSQTKNGNYGDRIPIHGQRPTADRVGGGDGEDHRNELNTCQDDGDGERVLVTGQLDCESFSSTSASGAFLLATILERISEHCFLSNFVFSSLGSTSFLTFMSCSEPV